jgi:hypothetical protein
MTALVWVAREGPGEPVHIWPEFFAPEEACWSERGETGNRMTCGATKGTSS